MARIRSALSPVDHVGALAAPDVVGAVGHAACPLARATEQVVLASVTVKADRGDGQMVAGRIAVGATVALDVVVAEVAVNQVAGAARIDVVVLVVALDVVGAAVGARVAERDGALRRPVRVGAAGPRDVAVVADDDVLGGVAEDRVAAVGLSGRALRAADDVVLVGVAVDDVAVAATRGRPGVAGALGQVEVGVHRGERVERLVERQRLRAVAVALDLVVAAAAAHHVVGAATAHDVDVVVAVHLVVSASPSIVSTEAAAHVVVAAVAVHRVGFVVAVHLVVVGVAAHRVSADAAAHLVVVLVAVHRVDAALAPHEVVVGAALHRVVLVEGRREHDRHGWWRRRASACRRRRGCSRGPSRPGACRPR